MNIFLAFDPLFEYFLHGRHQGPAFDYPLEPKASVKDIITTLGVRHKKMQVSPEDAALFKGPFQGKHLYQIFLKKLQRTGPDGAKGPAAKKKD